MNFFEFKEKLNRIKSGLNSNNYRDQKDVLISMQREVGGADLLREQKVELREIFDECFKKINSLRQGESMAYEHESHQNYLKLAPLVEQAHLHALHGTDDQEAWNFCIEVQQQFRGIKLAREVRETLYSRLQEAFDLVKARRNQRYQQKEVVAQKAKARLLPEIEASVEKARTNPDENTWSHLLELQQEIRDIDMTREAREQLLGRLQDAFDAIKQKKEEDHQVRQEELFGNAMKIEELVEEGEIIARQESDFKVAFERLKFIQQSFRELQVDPADREGLYNRLQQAFDVLKKRQEQYFNERDSESITNYNRLKPLIKKGLERAQTSMEFKKTREMLKRLQGEFKGIKMKPDSRQELYAMLQKAFDTLNHRHDEYLATKKEMLEFRVDSQLSDIEFRIEEAENELERYQEQIEELQELGDNPLFDKQGGDAPEDINNQIMVLRAAIARKEEMLSQLIEEYELLEQKKDKWAHLGEEE